jgi:hypothetical protein
MGPPGGRNLHDRVDLVGREPEVALARAPIEEGLLHYA